MSKKTRRIEMLVAESDGGDTGQWWTEWVTIPIDTPQDYIEGVSIAEWRREFEKMKRHERIAGIMVYNTNDEPFEYDEQVSYQVLRNIMVPQDSSADPKIIPLGAVVYESDDPAIVETNRENYDTGKILIEYTPEGVFDARAPYLYSVNMEDLEQIDE